MLQQETDRGLSFKNLNDFEDYVSTLEDDNECAGALAELDITLSRLQAQIDKADFESQNGEFVCPDWYKKASYCLRMHKSYRSQLQNRKGQLRRAQEQLLYNERRAFEIRFEKLFLYHLKKVVSKDLWDEAHLITMQQSEKNSADQPTRSDNP